MKKVNNDAKWIGQRFGKLTVVGIRYDDTRNRIVWDCQCDCGKISKGVSPYNIKNGHTRSCGCGKAAGAQSRITHGQSDTRLYGIWEKMKDRCERKNTPAYPNYGGRGISICAEWHDFQNFYDWAMKHGYQEDLTIERIDNDGDYCPENCKWITRLEQAKNKRTTIRVDRDGEVMPLKTYCEKHDLPYKAVHLRITRYGMSLDEALDKPFVDQSQSLSRKCKEANMPYGTVLYRVTHGWSLEQALSEPIRQSKSRKGENK